MSFKLTNTDTRYGLVTKFLHWAIAFLILGLLSAGFAMTAMAFSPLKLEIYGLHKSFGMTVLGLAVIRVIWRFVSRQPHHLPSHAPWERALAGFTHILLYIAIFAMPLTGWAMSSAGDFPNTYFGLFEIPDITPKDEAVFEFLKDAHTVWAFVILAILALHMAGAFKHHILDRDETLQRMSFERLGLVGGLLMALAFGALWATPLAIAAYDDLFEDRLKCETEGARGVLSTISTLFEETLKCPTETAGARIPIAEPAAGWRIIPEKSRLEFEAKQYGQSFKGRFESFGGEILFDPARLDEARADIVIDIASLTTGSEDRDKQALSADWFDAAAFSQARFTADDFERTGEGAYIAYGTLEIRGVSQPIALPFELEIKTRNNVQEAEMAAEIVLNRSDFGIGRNQWQSGEAIAHQVRIEIRLEASNTAVVP